MKNLHLLSLIVFASSCGTNQSEKKDAARQILPKENIAGNADTSGLRSTEEKRSDGSVVFSGSLYNGKKEGSWATYYNSGALQTLTSYVEDKKEGWYLEFGENTNQVVKRIMYHNDQRNGEYKEFYYSTTKEQRFYQNGKQEGVTTIFYDGGKRMEEGNYKNGLRDGISRWFDQNGQVTIQYEYKEGVLVKKDKD
ncbi:toxin-antitoxin system YwqK family antitoxin [soil metagenome]